MQKRAEQVMHVWDFIGILLSMQRMAYSESVSVEL